MRCEHSASLVRSRPPSYWLPPPTSLPSGGLPRRTICASRAMSPKHVPSSPPPGLVPRSSRVMQTSWSSIPRAWPSR